MTKEMRRKKIRDFKVTLQVPYLWKKNDGNFSLMKTIVSSWPHLLVEKDGQCYVSLYELESGKVFSPMLVPIKEKFDDIEGEAFEYNEAGSNASETEE